MVLRKKLNLSNIIQCSTTAILTGRHIHKIILQHIEYLNLDFISTQNGEIDTQEKLYQLPRVSQLFDRHRLIIFQLFRNSNVVATCSGKQTHSEEQCRQWGAVYYTSGPKAESPLSQGPRPVFCENLIYLKRKCPNPPPPNSLKLV